MLTAEAYSRTLKRLRVGIIRAPSKGMTAMCQLAFMQLTGDGIPVDYEPGVVNLLQASLAGADAARDALKKTIMGTLPSARWDSVVNRVNWPKLVLILGPLVDGRLPGHQGRSRVSTCASRNLKARIASALSNPS